jgi:hypothetical protein
MEVYVDRKDFGVWCNFKDQDNNIWDKLSKISSIHSSICSLPDGTCLRAELYAENTPATSVITLLNEADDRLQFRVFEMPMYNGIDSTRVTYEHVQDCLGDGHRIQTAEVMYRYLGGRVISERLWNSMIRRAEDLCIEGFVARTHHTGFAFKIKPKKTVDAFVIGFTVSDSITFYGKLKAFQVAVFDKSSNTIEIASVSNGLDHEFKLTCDPKKYIGRVMEAEYDSVAAKGKLRFPSFIRWRSDKNKHQCHLDQLEENIL